MLDIRKRLVGGGYTVCGIVVPLLAYMVFNRILSELRRIRQNGEKR